MLMREIWKERTVHTSRAGPCTRSPFHHTILQVFWSDDDVTAEVAVATTCACEERGRRCVCGLPV